jgi:hypothetical protein
VTLGGDRATLAASMIKGAIWSGTEMRDVEMLELEPSKPITMAAPSAPEAIELHLLDAAGEILDRHLESRSGGGEPAHGRVLGDVNRSPSDLATVEAAITSGESEIFEFKEFINPGDPKMREVYETVVAFGNTNGGVLIVGIDDYCRVVGVERDLLTNGRKRSTFDLTTLVDEYMAEIKKGIRELLHRVPSHVISAVEIEGHTVVAVGVRAGIERRTRCVTTTFLCVVGRTTLRRTPIMSCATCS